MWTAGRRLMARAGSGVGCTTQEVVRVSIPVTQELLDKIQPQKGAFLRLVERLIMERFKEEAAATLLGERP